VLGSGTGNYSARDAAIPLSCAAIAAKLVPIMTARSPSNAPSSVSTPPSDAEALEALVIAMEELQLQKVFDLARRLKPNLTLEDMRNPHDFPELEDPDWHYEDGVLTGIQSVVTAVRAYRRDQHRG
jgi:hypothetical protein